MPHAVEHRSTPESIVLAVDAGQTGIRVAVRPVAGPGENEPHEFPGLRTGEPLAPQLAARIAEVLRRERLDPARVNVGIGSTGLADAAKLADELRGILDSAQDARLGALCVAHDSATSYLGALGDTQGVVVAAGTGSIILGVGESESARVDGWGYLMGDDGSGFSIGQRGWRAVMRAHDGRGPETALLQDFAADMPDLEAAYTVVQQDPDRVRRVASYSRRVTAHAQTDAVAREIAEWAGAELARSVIVAARRVGLGAGGAAVPVAQLGKVLTDPTVQAAFRARLDAELPGAACVEPVGTGLDGAAQLPSLSPDSALASMVARA